MIYLLCILFICSVFSIIAAASAEKNPTVQYTRWDTFSYVIDAVLVCLFLFMELQFIASGFAGTVEGFEVLLNIVDGFTLFLLPASFFSIAASIFLRKRGKSGWSFLAQFLTVPFYLVCLMIYCIILS